MVWFQCEDCGENLKKPKLPNHFRMCSAYKLSCIDCGEMFSQQSVQSHTQCITEMEKYGPKDQSKASHNAPNKSNKPKPNSDVDVNVGLSSCPPWFCSLCKTQATSKQTLMLHADGKKHRAKARAFHASQKQSTQAEDVTPDETRISADVPKIESVEANGVTKKDEPVDREPQKDPPALVTGEKESLKKSKRKHDAPTELTTETQKTADALNNGEVIQTERQKFKKRKCTEIGGHADKHEQSKEASQHKIKWKKLVISTLKSNPDGAMKLKKLQKLVIKGLLESGVNDDESLLRDMLIDKINSSPRFVIDKKCIRLASKNEES